MCTIYPNSSTYYSIIQQLQGRCMASVLADTTQHRFLLSTNSFKEDNEIHLINYSEDLNRIDQEAVLSFKQGEIWSLSPSPYNKEIVAAGIQNKKDNSSEIQILQLPTMESSQEESKTAQSKAKNLKVKTSFKPEGELRSNIHSLCWEDTECQEGL